MGRFLFFLTELITTSRTVILQFLNRSMIFLSIMALATMIFEYGFESSNRMILIFHMVQAVALSFFGVGMILRRMVERSRFRRSFELVLAIFAFSLVVFFRFFSGPLGFIFPPTLQQFVFHGFIVVVFITELGNVLSQVKSLYVNPSLLFVLSFLAIIVLGGFLLKMPKATSHGIGYLDSFFMSTSAVCVTGLSSINIQEEFTTTGQVILLVLVQLGGLGIMTFTSFFGYFFQGTASFQNRLFMKDFLNENEVGKVFHTLGRVVLVTFIIELLGAGAIYFAVKDVHFAGFLDRGFFSIFHSISAFCNAGFSTLGAGLQDFSIRFNYPLHLIIAFLIILGGLGFPMMFNFFQAQLYRCKSLLFRVLGKGPLPKRPRMIRLNTRLAFATTLILLVGGTIAFYLLERNGVLKYMDGTGQWVYSFFGSVTARTAGYSPFNPVGLGATTLLMLMFLMWVGASPASTGGGIKTSTLAVAFFTIWNIARGRNKVEIYQREISSDIIHRAFIAIALSLFFIGGGAFFLTLFESQALNAHETSLERLVFESFSAFGTVGLSVGVTPALTTGGKITVMILMFLGRVGGLTLITALFRRMKTLPYSYPSENVLVG